MAETRVAVDVDGRRLDLSNLDKLLYPEAGFTKAQVIDYYTRIAPVMLPHLADRPLTLHRFPNGTGAKGFYEKQCPDHRPDWVATAAIHARGVGRFGERRRAPRDIDFCLVQDRPTLVWLANLACLELHVLLARAADVQQPTADLPGAGLVTSRGETTIAPLVVEKIATRAASEVDGVGGVVETGLSRLLPWSIGSGGQPARASADVGTETVSVDLTVNVVYPEPVAAVTNRVRDQVVRRLAELCGLRATEVNIAVPALVAPGPGRRRRVE